MRELKIMTVCGFGVGSSLILKMKVDEMLKGHGIEAETFPQDVTTALSETSDLIFTSEEISGQLEGNVSVPLIKIANFMDINEIEEKGLDIIKEMMAE